MENMIVDDNEMERTDIAEDSLISNENLDRASPELWPESNIAKYASQDSSLHKENSWSSSDFNQEDMNQIYRLGLMPVTDLIAEVKKLHDSAYQLGLEEAKEMTRGKYLNIFKKK